MFKWFKKFLKFLNTKDTLTCPCCGGIYWYDCTSGASSQLGGINMGCATCGIIYYRGPFSELHQSGIDNEIRDIYLRDKKLDNLLS
jgi:hypothetical protein